MEFIGRKNEIKIINSELNKKGFSSILLYGRRRVGKTKLISYCLSKRKERIVFFTAAKLSYKDNLNRFEECVKKSFDINYSFSSLVDILKYIGEQANKEKIIIVIDEFSYFKNSQGMIDNEIKLFIDENIHKNLKIILSGSLIEIMKNIIEADQPLYGRFTSIISLKPLNYYESSLFYPNRNNEEKVALYSIFGGIPHYLKLIDNKLSVDDNIINLFFSENNVMDNEIEILLYSEISKIEIANSALSIINKKSISYSDINQKLSINNKGNESTHILKKLMTMELIDKEIEINNDSSKKGLYYIKDNALLFYFTYILPNKSKLALTSPRDFYKEYIKDELLQNFIPKQFEKICKEFLIFKNKKNQIKPMFLSIGKLTYHDKEKGINNEYDIVTQDKNGYTYYECKYLNRELNKKDVEDIISKSNNSSFGFYNYGFFSKKGFDSSIKTNNYKLFTLDDLYNF